MKILLIEPCYENFGGYFRAFGIAKALSRKGVKVDLLLATNKKISLRIKRKKSTKSWSNITYPASALIFLLPEGF